MNNNILIKKAIEITGENKASLEASIWELFSAILQECLLFFQMNFIDSEGKYKTPNLINPVFIWRCVMLVRKIMDLISEYKKKHEAELVNT